MNISTKRDNNSDTTANTFINIFTQLANNPHTLQKLQHEIDAIYNAQYGTDKGSDDKGSDVPEVILNGNSAATRYLDAVINEGLRLNPAVPSGVQRVTTEGGVTINGTYIPGGVNCRYPTYTAQSGMSYLSD
jgi:cytochrome P450